MLRMGLILLAMVSLVAGGVLIDHGGLGGHTSEGWKPQTSIPDVLGGGRVLTKDELLRQKYILDIVNKIYVPLQDDLLKLDNRSIVCNKNLYMDPLSQDMHSVLDLICSDQMLRKQKNFSLYNEDHIRQAKGLYKLMVAAREFDTFLRLAIYSRQNINTEMFVNCLVLALSEREDTRMLVVPALYEILSQIYVTDQIPDQELFSGIFISGEGLLSQDIGMKSYVTLLINKLLLKQNLRDDKHIREDKVTAYVPRCEKLDRFLRDLAVLFYNNRELYFMNSGPSTAHFNDERHFPITNIYEKRRTNYFEHVFDTVFGRYNTEYQSGNANNQVSYAGDYFRERDLNVENQGSRNRHSIINPDVYQIRTFNAKLLLHTLQQLDARLNIERIALGQGVVLHAYYGIGPMYLLDIDIPGLTYIENFVRNIYLVLSERIVLFSDSSYNQKVNEIALLLSDEIRNICLFLGSLAEETNKQQPKKLVSNLLENLSGQVLLSTIVNIIDFELGKCAKRDEFISTVTGVTINSVKVGELRTYVEQTDVDFTNLLNNNYNNINETSQRTNKVVVGHINRLNHKSFEIDIDVTSDHQQQVVVRNFLVPKGANNVTWSLNEGSKYLIVLNVTKVKLEQGRNTLKLKSNDITTTGRDTTPLNKMYELVMQALNGQVILQQDQLVGQTTLLPHHLLLPRGHADGLPMQLITVITPADGYTDATYGQAATGLNTLLHDNLPLNYPLHCRKTNLEQLISVPNIMVTEVKIYHGDIAKMPFTHR